MRLYQAVDKTFLNKVPYETGSVAWYVELHGDRATRNPSNMSGLLTVTDCSRTISLEFDAHNSATFKERINKLRTLQDSLDGLSSALKEARLTRVKAILSYRKEQKGKRFNKDDKDASSS